MAEDDGTPSYSFGAGGDPYSSGLGMMALLGGSRGMQDPYLAMLQPQMSYAQGLLGQAAQAGPVASPWQAAARAMSGVLGGIGMRDYARQYQQMLAGEVEQARRATQGALSGLDLSGPPAQGAGPSAPPKGAAAGPEQGADASTLAALPDVKALPQEIQGPLVQAMLSAKLGPNAGAQYARMIKAESGGQHFGASGNQLTTSPAGALGAAQVMPATFADMAKKYNITGDISDVNANLSAGAHYFADGLGQSNGDLAGGAAYYNGGPKALATYQQGGQLPPETQRYLVATNATGNAGAAAQPDVATNPQANMQAGWQAALQLQLRVAQMAASPNPYVRAAVPQLTQIANTLKTVGLWSPAGTDPANGQQWLRNNMTGETKAVGAGLRPEGVAMKDLAALAPIAQADPNLLQAGDRQRLQTAITQIYKPTISLDTKTGIQQFHWEHPPPAWAKTFMGDTSGGGAGGATQPAQGGTAAAPARSPAEAEAAIARATEDYKADVETTSKFSAAAASGDDTLAANQSIRSILASGNVKPGQFAPFMAQVASVMRGAGYDENAVKKITGMDPVAAQELNKFLFQLQSAKLREMGAREPGSVLQMFTQNYPNWQSRPETIGALTRTLDMQVLYAKDRAAAMNQWMQEHRGNIEGYERVSSPAFNKWFSAQHDPREYAAAALAASTGGDGKPVPYKEWAEGLKDKASVARVTSLVNQNYPGTMIDYGAHGVGQAGGP